MNAGEALQMAEVGCVRILGMGCGIVLMGMLLGMGIRVHMRVHRMQQFGHIVRIQDKGECEDDT
jgi:hypothetical protein